MASLRDAWRAVADPARSALLEGSTGRNHLMAAASALLGAGTFRAEDPAARLGVEMLFFAWAEDPLDPELAGPLSRLTPLLPPGAGPLLAEILNAHQPPADTAEYAGLAAGRDLDALREHIDQRIAADPGHLFWAMHAMRLALVQGDFARAEAALDRMAGQRPGLAPALDLARIPLALCAGQPDRAARLARDAQPVAGPGFCLGRQGLATLAMGDKGRALARMLASLEQSPWQTSLARVAADLAEGVGGERAGLPGSCAILLYSYNKADELDATLRSLAASDLGGHRLAVLNNGSTDHTAGVLDAWAERLGERMERIDLPANIGAAAARNWLAQCETATGADFLLYLDDDVELPPDWLGLLGAAVARMPEAGVWGATVVDHAQPGLIQSAGMHLRPAPDETVDLSRRSPHPFRLSELHIQGPDIGLFRALGPCGSVTGCCHLFRTERLRAAGPFSIMLMPTQYDDMERDLRMLEAGLTACHQGHLTIRHKKRTGIASLTKAAEEGNALANKYKMQAMHSPQDIARAVAVQRTAVEAHLDARLALLDKTRADME